MKNGSLSCRFSWADPKISLDLEALAREKLDLEKAKLEAETKVLVAQIGAQSKEVESPLEQMAEGGVEEPNTNAVLAAAMQGFTEAINSLNRPKQIMRGPDGRVQGII